MIELSLFARIRIRDRCIELLTKLAHAIGFALSGSSSRKLKRGGANLLAGRAFVYSLFPLPEQELGSRFDLEHALQWGTLPRSVALKSAADKTRYLRAYAQVYVREEVQVEQLLRKLGPFRLFLPEAAQMNGKILNYLNFARDGGVDPKTIESDFEILEETYLDFFDEGVKRALQNSLGVPLRPSASAYGEAFESWFVNEVKRFVAGRELDFELSYLRTKDGVEIDLVVGRPGRGETLVEIKSGSEIDEQHVKSLVHFKNDFPKADLICASPVKREKKIGSVWVLPWKKALTAIGL